MAAVELAVEVGTKPACESLGVSRATYYRRQRPVLGQQQPRPTPARALREEERKEVLATACSERFVDRAPAEIVATLADEGVYQCSVRTMYRILEANASVRERRNQLRHPEYVKPELVATGPNQVWSWDITKLLGPEKWTYYYLYVLLDIFSRYVVGWMVAKRETAALACRLIEETCDRWQVEPEILTLHSDRGAPIRAKTTAQLAADLGLTQSFSRPHVSDDNPFIEAEFKTLKYHPGFPSRFGSYEGTCLYLRPFFGWYNDEHRHSGLGMLTPAAVHFGRAAEVLAARQAVLDAAFAAHPERFPRGRPRVPALPTAVYINPPATAEQAAAAGVCAANEHVGLAGPTTTSTTAREGISLSATGGLSN